MPVTAKAYGLHFAGQYSATAARRVDWVTDTIKAALVVAAYTPNQDTHDFFDDVSANELAAGGGYTALGVALTGKSVAYDSATNQTRLISTGLSTWTFTGTKAFQYAVVFKDTGSAATSPLIGWVDLGAQSITDSVFNIDWDDTLGVLSVAAAA